METCKGCGAEIEWARTEAKDRPIPLNAEPDLEDGNLVVTDQTRTTELNHEVPVVRYVRTGDGDRVAHFTTCPKAGEFRRKR